MNNTKKIAMILLVFMALAVSLGAFAVLAANEPAYSVNDVTVETEGSFSLNIAISENPGLISLNLDVEYDESILKLESVENLGLLSGFTNPSPEISSPYTLRWSDSLGVDNAANGNIAKLNFKVLSTEDADTCVKIIHNNAFSSNGGGKNIAFKNAEANISVRNKHTVTFYGEDGSTVVAEHKYFPGESVTLPETPVKDPDGENKYTFDKWTPEVETKVSADASYTASFTSAPLSDDAGLASLNIDGVALSPAFSADVTEYSANVEYRVSTLSLSYTTSNEFALVTVSGNELSVGENTLTLTVTAEKGNTKVFTVKVTRANDPNYIENSDAMLESVVPSHGVLTPVFNSHCTEYLLYVENSAESVSFVCTPRNDRIESISTDEEHALEHDRTEIILFCVAENGDRAEYKITVVRLPKYEGEIPEFVLGSQGGNETKDPNDKDDGQDPTDEIKQSDKKNTRPKTVVIIIVAIAAVCAIASVVGIIFLVVSSKRKNRVTK